jgi:hypothetical protein
VQALRNVGNHLARHGADSSAQALSHGEELRLAQNSLNEITRRIYR